MYIALTLFETERGVIPTQLTQAFDNALLKSHFILLKLAEFQKDAQNQCLSNFLPKDRVVKIANGRGLGSKIVNIFQRL